MCNPLNKIVETITEKITEMVIQSVVRHVRFITRYRDNMKNLEAEKNNLEDEMGKIEEKVDQALTRGEEIEKEVLDWKKKADEMKNEVLNFMYDEADKENMQCFKFQCPNIISRYRLSKHVQKKIDDIKGHIQKGNFNTVSHRKPPPSEIQLISSGDYVGFNSRESVFKTILEALEDPKVNMIGVYGTGGIGKTKMVEEVGKQVKKDGIFYEVIKAVVSHDANVRKIQGQLADSLSTKLDAETEKGRADQLWNRLNNGKKNLVILDDIWQEMDLNVIGIPITDGNKGCKVVLTSRNRDVWKNMQVDNREFLIQILSESEAWHLFKRKVGNSVESAELRSVAEGVCKECGGLPVAILAVGAALKGKNEYAWESALNQLKNSKLKNIPGINQEVYASLKLSYDRLEPNEAKSCFLLCCLFPEDAEISIDVLVRHCVARRLLDPNPDTLENARRGVLTLFDTLRTSCLLLDGTDENVVKMHDVIRDVAISIAQDQNAFLVKHGVQEWPYNDQWESSSVISLRSENIQPLPDDLKCPQLDTLLMECIHPSECLTVSDSFFSGMEKLTVLDLKQARMSCQSSLANLVKLRMLCLNYCELADTAILMNLLNCNLEILSLQGSDIKELPPELAQLTRLRVLDLRYCDSLTVISPGAISNLSRLEELYIANSFDKWEATTADELERSNVSLMELKSLTRLTTLHIHIPNLMLLPKDIGFEHLIWFRISVGRCFYNDKISSSTKILRLTDIPFKDEFNKLLERAEKLVLVRLEGLKKVLHDRDGEWFFRLKHLKVEDCHDLEHLLGNPKCITPSPSRSFNELTKLRIQNCGLKYLFSPSCARGLPKLQQLKIQDCEIMEEIVGTEGEQHEEVQTNKLNFSQLKHLSLNNLPNLISFYPKMEKTVTTEGNSSTIDAQSLFNEKVALPALNYLDIDGVPNITEIWDKELLSEKEAGSFCQLRTVYVWNCDELVNVASSKMLSWLLKLEYLSMTRCPKMEVIIVSEKEKEKETANDDIVVFPQLSTLMIANLQNLKSFCSRTTRSEAQPLFNHQVALPALNYLNIDGVPNITEIWDKELLSEKEAESFRQLRIVCVWNCDELVNVASSKMLSRLLKLEDLSISGCPKMEVIIVLEKEKEKETANDDIVVFPLLRTLGIDNLQNLKSFCSRTTRSEAQPLFNHQVAFPKLEKLSVIECANSAEIHLCLLLPQRFQNLGKLIVRNCDGVRKVFHLEGEEGLNVVGDLGQHVGQCITKVRMMELDSLPQLTCLWNYKDDPHLILGFRNLKYLVIKNCSLLRNLFTSSVAMALEQLEILYLESCTMMEEVVIATTDNKGQKEVSTDDDHEIAFLKLEWLILKNLPNLQSFCSNENYNFNLPSLKKVVLKRCPKMQTFASGGLVVRMPQTTFVSTRGNEGLHIKDLNEYLKQRSLAGEECAMMDDNDYAGEEQQFSKLY